MNIIKPPLDEEEALYQSILEDISSGALEGGQRLKVSELAKRFNVSTSPIREVLRRMQGEGFVEINRNRGATVKQADAGTIQNIFEILELLEPYFVTWFAEYASTEMIDDIAAIQGDIRVAGIDDIQRFRRLDLQFHSTICQRHYNQVAVETWHNLRKALNVHGSRLRVSPARFSAVLVEHEELIAAFRANDVQRADKAIRSHVGGSIVQMTKQMRAMGL